MEEKLLAVINARASVSIHQGPIIRGLLLVTGNTHTVGREPLRHNATRATRFCQTHTKSSYATVIAISMEALASLKTDYTRDW